MRKRIRRPDDVNQWAKQIVDESTEEEKSVQEPTPEEISIIMRAMGKRGGKIGGVRRRENMSDKEASAAGRKAANARWKGVKKLTISKVPV